jgi:hypothetical protein
MPLVLCHSPPPPLALTPTAVPSSPISLSLSSKIDVSLLKNLGLLNIFMDMSYVSLHKSFVPNFTIVIPRTSPHLVPIVYESRRGVDVHKHDNIFLDM